MCGCFLKYGFCGFQEEDVHEKVGRIRKISHMLINADFDNTSL